MHAVDEGFPVVTGPLFAHPQSISPGAGYVDKF
jgi:hypothetical protein